VLCASGHVAEPELSGTRSGSRAVGLIFKVLCTGVPGLQGTNTLHFLYVCSSFDNIMPVIQSSWRIQISVQETIVSSHDLASMWIRIIVSIKNLIRCLNIRSYSSYICHILMFKLDDVMPVI
jgi:hypothetical protein